MKVLYGSGSGRFPPKGPWRNPGYCDSLKVWNRFAEKADAEQVAVKGTGFIWLVESYDVSTAVFSSPFNT